MKLKDILSLVLCGDIATGENNEPVLVGFDEEGAERFDNDIVCIATIHDDGRENGAFNQTEAQVMADHISLRWNHYQNLKDKLFDLIRSAEVDRMELHKHGEAPEKNHFAEDAKKLLELISKDEDLIASYATEINP